MPKKIYPQELHQAIEKQAGRVNFLHEQMKECETGSYFSDAIESAYADKGFTTVLSQIKENCSEIMRKTISEQLEYEERILKTLSQKVSQQ